MFLWIFLFSCYCIISPVRVLLCCAEIASCPFFFLLLFLRPIFSLFDTASSLFKTMLLYPRFLFSPSFPQAVRLTICPDGKDFPFLFRLKYSYMPVMSSFIVLVTIGLCDPFLSHACWRSSRYTNLPFYLWSYSSSSSLLFSHPV